MKSHTTLLKKIILLFISIFIPLTCISLIIINQSNQKLKKQVLSSIDSNNTSYISQLKTSLDNLYISCFNLINQSNFSNFSSTLPDYSIYERSTNVKLIREQLSGIALSSPFVQRASVYFLEHAVSYHSKGNSYGSFQALSEEEIHLYRSMLQDYRLTNYYLDPLTEEETFSLFITPTYSDSYFSSITLSQYELEKYFETNSSYKGEGYLLSSDTSLTLSNLSPSIQKELEHKIEDTGFHDHCTLVQLNGSDYYLFSYEIPNLASHYVRLIPTSSLLENIDTTPKLILFFFTLVCVACILFFAGVYRLIHQPYHKLTTAFEELEQGNFGITITDNKTADFAYLFHAFNDMSLKLEQLIERDYNQKILLQKAELKQLQAQINPHFLYNSFFMLQRMIKMEMMEEAQEVANALGIYFRYLTRNSMDNVALEEEYEHAKTYAYIQGLRFEGRIKIQFDDLPSEFSSLPVPKLILQPLLENAFQYGLHNKMENGLLLIRFSVSGDQLTIIVEENGEELTDDALNTLSSRLETVRTDTSGYEMTGLLNIQRRLIIFSNSKNSLQVSRSDLGGLRVSIILQKTEEVEAHALTDRR